MATTIAVIALVVALMSVPSVFQQFWGGPKVVFEFQIGRGRKSASVLASNVPVTNPLLRFLRVRRESAREIHVSIDISERGTQRVFESFAPFSPRELPPSKVATMRVAEHIDDSTWKFGERDEVPPGHYVIVVSIHDTSGRSWFI